MSDDWRDCGWCANLEDGERCPKHFEIRPNLSTSDYREFWAFVKTTARKVATFPKWKRGGSNAD